ncbi:DEAD/DEAH box helicase [Demequina rhizosphaerae]|uniref:DEAD/DEAH box helicase n=1 Tax=Demequina rhizosphaerae TaxID=1638985 RepID=UPI0009E4F81D|nr:DEAD/DEAH box helicase [Demequina rhizosphaerae]
MSPTTFAELGVPVQLTDVLEHEGKTHAFPIQVGTLPDTLAGRDVLGRGRTGSGKTLAFSLPTAARLGARGGRAAPGRPRALILAPTRELATQIDAVIAPLAAAYGMRTATIFGGVSQRRQEQALRRGVEIVVACPGRLEDLMGQGHVSLDSVEITVLDEADHMADLGFLPGVTRIMNATPQRGQRLLFSATLDNGVDKLVKRFLSDPVTHAVDPADSPVEAMTHHVFHTDGVDAKRDLIHTLASGASRRILFTRTKHQAKKLAKQLTAAGIPAVDLHGNLSQNARDRNLAAFAGEGVRVLVATDVAARGVHVDGVELVVHVDPPAEHKAYLHRSGRTARAGSAGDVVTVVLPEQRRETSQLLRKAGITVRPESVSSASPQVSRLVGEVAAHVEPSAAGPAPAPAQRGRQQSQPQAGGGRRRHGRGRSGGASGTAAPSGSTQRAQRPAPRGTAPSSGKGGAAASSGKGGAAAFSSRGGSGASRRRRSR